MPCSTIKYGVPATQPVAGDQSVTLTVGVRTMVTIMIMQRMSVAMEYGVILKWLKKEGDRVRKGEPVVEVFGEKSEFELEAPADGVLLKILCDVDDEIPISEPIAVIGEEGEEVPDVRPRKLSAGVPAAATPGVTAGTTAPAATSAIPGGAPQTTPQPTSSRLPGGRIRASPRARMRARELGVDLSQVVGTGPGGRIVERDVVASSQTVAPVQARVRSVEPLSPLRRTIARRMTQSWQHPHITMITEIDMTEVVAFREEINRDSDVRVSFNDIVIKAVADTLERFPRFNATLVGNELHLLDDINIGVAMATDDGLIVPVVRTANRKTITEIARETKDLGRRARAGTLRPEELTGSTFTVSNLGPFRVDLFIPVVNPPETAILALGQIKERPVVVGGSIEVRPVMMASCAVDHRVLDGAPVGQFLAALKDYLENPYFMSV